MSRVKLIWWLIWCSCLLSGCWPDQERLTSTKLEAQALALEKVFQERNARDLFHGGVFVTHFGATLYEGYFGIADRTWDIPVTSTVKFDIASLNKAMTAALILRTVEAGNLRLEDRLVDVIDSYDVTGSFHPGITLHHLLCHRSGLPDYDAVPEPLRRQKFLALKRMRPTNAEYLNFISQLEPVNLPDQQFYYSNFAYHLLAIILEDTYGQPFADVLRRELTAPLGLTNTLAVTNNEVVIPELAGAYQWKEGHGFESAPFIDLSLGRRIFSTVEDLNRWAQVMDNPGYLSQASLALMQQNHLADLGEEVSYGYGWVAHPAGSSVGMGNLNISKPYLIHGGSSDGFKSMLININQGEYVISFLSNVGDRTEEMQLARRIVEQLHL